MMGKILQFTRQPAPNNEGLPSGWYYDTLDGQTVAVANDADADGNHIYAYGEDITGQRGYGSFSNPDYGIVEITKFGVVHGSRLREK